MSSFCSACYFKITGCFLQVSQLWSVHCQCSVMVMGISGCHILSATCYSCQCWSEWCWAGPGTFLLCFRPFLSKAALRGPTWVVGSWESSFSNILCIIPVISSSQLYLHSAQNTHLFIFLPKETIVFVSSQLLWVCTGDCNCVGK